MKGFRQCAVAARFWGFALDLLSQSGARVRVRVGSERHNLVHRARSPRLSLALVVVYSCVRFSVVWDSFCGMHEYTCLLYTSPSPRDQRGSRMPSSA